MKKRAAILLAVELTFVGVVIAVLKLAQMRASSLSKEFPVLCGDWASS